MLVAGEKLPPKLPPEIIKAFCDASREAFKNLALQPIAYDGKPLERRKLAL